MSVIAELTASKHSSAEVKQGALECLEAAVLWHGKAYSMLTIHHPVLI